MHQLATRMQSSTPSHPLPRPVGRPIEDIAHPCHLHDFHRYVPRAAVKSAIIKDLVIPHHSTPTVAVHSDLSWSIRCNYKFQHAFYTIQKTGRPSLLLSMLASH